MPQVPVPIASLTAVLEHHPGVAAGYLFGSEARGNPHRDSDVDIAVLLDAITHPRPADRRATRRRGAFTRATLSRAADLQPFIARSRRALLETLAR